ncbi:MAG: DUF4315 family protein [Oscillibacter sp.]|nr:DUF4315 family protein [Oscillibacter sp.]
MNPKITKLRTELAKNKDKITELQERNRGIERQIRELEDFSIVGLVRESGMTLEQFAALFAAMKDAPMPVIQNENTEEPAHEEN